MMRAVLLAVGTGKFSFWTFPKPALDLKFQEQFLLIQ